MYLAATVERQNANLQKKSPTPTTPRRWRHLAMGYNVRVSRFSLSVLINTSQSNLVSESKCAVTDLASNKLSAKIVSLSNIDSIGLTKVIFVLLAYGARHLCVHPSAWT